MARAAGYYFDASAAMRFIIRFRTGVLRQW
jgi:hypothetical protein